MLRPPFPIELDFYARYAKWLTEAAELEALCRKHGLPTPPYLANVISTRDREPAVAVNATTGEG